MDNGMLQTGVKNDMLQTGVKTDMQTGEENDMSQT